MDMSLEPIQQLADKNDAETITWLANKLSSLTGYAAGDIAIAAASGYAMWKWWKGRGEGTLIERIIRFLKLLTAIAVVIKRYSEGSLDNGDAVYITKNGAYKGVDAMAKVLEEHNVNPKEIERLVDTHRKRKPSS